MTDFYIQSNYKSSPKTTYIFSIHIFINQFKIQNTMKKILSLFALVLMSCMGAWAQAPDFTDLVVKEVKACTQTIESGKWYVISNVRKDGGNYATPTPVYDQSAGQALKREPFGQTVRTVLTKNKPAADVAKYLVRFDDHATIAGTKCVQFGTGNYVAPLSANNDGTNVTTSATDAAGLQVYGASQTKASYAGSPYTSAGVGFNFSTGTDNFGKRWDGNGVGATVLVWGSGKITSDANNVWYVEEVVLGEIELLDFTVTITGAPAGTKITYNGHEYGNGETIEQVEGVTVAEVTVPAIDGYQSSITIVGTAITVTYIEVDTYAPTFNILTDHTRGERQVSAIKLGEQSITINGAGKVYQNLTKSEGFTVEAGETVTPAIIWNGAWMHGMVYVDTDPSDHVFTAEECVSHTALDGSPSLATGFSSFVAPAAVGDYRMRYKVDWATLNPNGASDLIANGGYILDVTLHVVPAPEKATVTYEINLNGAKIGEVVKEEAIGQNTAYTLPASAADYVNVDFTPAEITGNMTVQVNTSYKDGALPFKLDGTKYNLALNRDPNLQIYVSGENINTMATSNASYVAPEYATQEDYKWVFGGNWYTGFTLKNAGANKFVTYNSVAPADKTKATLVEEPNTGAYFELRIKNSTEYYFRLMGTNNGAYISNNGGVGTTYLTNWNSENNYNSSDKGAQFVITEAVELPEPPQFDWAAYEALLSELKTLPIGENLGQYSMEGYNSWQIDAALAVYQEDYDAKDETAFDDDMDGMRMIADNLQLNMPQKGAVIRIKASDKWIETPTYLSGNNRAAGDRAAFVVEPERDNKDVVWMYDGQFLTCYGNGLTAANNSNFMNIQMYPKTTRIEFQAAQNGTVGKYNIKFAGSRFLYTNKDNYSDAGSGASAEGYNFELESAADYFAIDYGTAGWASLYLPVDVALNPEYGIEAAYIIKSEEDGYLKAEEIRYLPGFTPAIVKVNPEMAQGNNPFGKGCSWSGTSIETALDGSLWKMANSGDNTYVLNLDATGNPIFRHYTGATLGHCKAYYQKPAASSESVLRINFGEENPTAIMDAIMEAEFSGDVYDLTGRRINGVQNGVFIKNGRKVIK